MANIIIEGCDGSGKTSLAEAICKLDLRYSKQHMAAPATYEEARCAYGLLLGRIWSSDRTIFDRAHLSEMVYAPIMRGYSPYYMQAFELLLPKDTLLVVLTAPDDVLAGRFDGEYVTKEQMLRANAAYLDLFYRTLMPDKILLDSSKEGPYELALRVWNRAELKYGGDFDDRYP